ncbi:VirB3 family type IV secretion system protein [Marinicella sp. W31]|uniref:VirB3 family type IV secretion system protein n=1 Tax=Marinicella sp. W31 TaxID=3023713 RepID=UPI0037572583
MKPQPVYLALTRPPQFRGGLSFQQMIFLLMFTGLSIINLQNIMAFLVPIILFPFFRWMNKKDYFLIDLVGVRFIKTPFIRNRFYWNGCNTYDPMITQRK